MANMTEPEQTPGQVNGRALFDEQRQRVREVYMTGINDIMDACLAEFVLPEDQATIAADAAQFIVFMMAVKTTANRHQLPTKQNLLRAYWPIEKLIKKELPGMLLEFAKSAETQGIGLAT